MVSSNGTARPGGRTEKPHLHTRRLRGSLRHPGPRPPGHPRRPPDRPGRPARSSWRPVTAMGSWPSRRASAPDAASTVPSQATSSMRLAALCTTERNLATSSLATSRLRRSVRSRIESATAPSSEPASGAPTSSASRHPLALCRRTSTGIPRFFSRTLTEAQDRELEVIRVHQVEAPHADRDVEGAPEEALCGAVAPEQLAGPVQDHERLWEAHQHVEQGGAVDPAEPAHENRRAASPPYSFPAASARRPCGPERSPGGQAARR